MKPYSILREAFAPYARPAQTEIAAGNYMLTIATKLARCEDSFVVGGTVFWGSLTIAPTGLKKPKPILSLLSVRPFPLNPTPPRHLKRIHRLYGMKHYGPMVANHVPHKFLARFVIPSRTPHSLICWEILPRNLDRKSTRL